MKITPGKSKKTREAIKKAYDLFNSDECDWHQGMSILAQLLGYSIKETERKQITVAEFTERARKERNLQIEYSL